MGVFDVSGRWPAGQGAGGGLPWRDELESFFGAGLGAVRVLAGREVDAYLRQAGLLAAARGEQVCLSGAVLAAPGPVRRRVLAHEVAHVLQQTRGIRWAGRAGDSAGELELAARAVGAAFGAGRRPLARVPGAGPAGVRVQGHDSFEHRLLGDMPQALLKVMVAGQGTEAERQDGLARACGVLAYLGNNPLTVTESGLELLAGFRIRLLWLSGSDLYVTYGELNALADYLTSPAEIDETPRKILLPILQMIRTSGYNKLNALRAERGAAVWFPEALPSFGTSTVSTLIDSAQLEWMTTGLGEKGRDHYLGNLARNACHFAPFTWWRWQASYSAAAAVARQAHDSGDPELVRRAWLLHGYADHFLQDSFAAGHLINKTLIMQWFIDWAAPQQFLPVYGWDAIKSLTPGQQPGLSGQQLYTGPRTIPTPVSNDPQTAEELDSPAARMARTGIFGADPLARLKAYQAYLSMLASPACQIVVMQLHDLLNRASVTASCSSGSHRDFVIWGDDTMLRGGTGAAIASGAAQASRDSIAEILRRGESTTSWQDIFESFPDQVVTGGQAISLPDWHAVDGPLWRLCQSSDVFGSWKTWIFGGSTYLAGLGIVSVDQVPATFAPAWGPAAPVGWVTSGVSAACAWRDSAYLFYVPAGQAALTCIRAAGPEALSQPDLPAVAIAGGGCAAAVLGDSLTVAYCAAGLTVSALTTADGQDWQPVRDFAGITGAAPTGVAVAEVGGTQYAMYARQTAGQPSSLWYVTKTGAGSWSAPAPVPSSAYGSRPALATDGQALYVAFQHGDQGIYTGQLTAQGWTEPSARHGILTVTGTGVSLAWVGRTLYLSYQGTDWAPHWEIWDPQARQWTDYHMPAQRVTGPVTVTELSGGPVLVFAQGDSEAPGALAWSALDGSVASPAASLGAFASDYPPLLLPYARKTYAFSTSDENVILHTFDGTSWSLPAVVPAAILSTWAGRVGGDVRVNADGSATLWLAASEPQGTVLAATFDGTTWVKLPDVAPRGSCQGGVALAACAGAVYAFWENNAVLRWSRFNDETRAWGPAAAVPGVSWPASTTVTVTGDSLYLGYVCADATENHGLIYTLAYDGASFQAPAVVGTQQALTATLSSFDGRLILVLLGRGDKILYSLWKNPGDSQWGGSASLGAASTAPGLTAIAATVAGNASSHRPALLAITGWAANPQSGQFSRQMTSPGT